MERLDGVFGALSDGTRRAILARLTKGEAPLSELAEPFPMSQTAVSKHVRVLEDAGLVELEKRGRSRYCRLAPEPMREAAAWLESYEQYWSSQLASLGRHLAQEDTP